MIYCTTQSTVCNKTVTSLDETNIEYKPQYMIPYHSTLLNYDTV